MGRPGEFYDQDGEDMSPGGPGTPSHAGRGGFYDQDGIIEPPRPDPRAEARRQRESDRRREREIEILRESHGGKPVAPRTSTPAGPPAEPGPLRISSRPVINRPDQPRRRPPGSEPRERPTQRDHERREAPEPRTGRASAPGGQPGARGPASQAGLPWSPPSEPARPQPHRPGAPRAAPLSGDPPPSGRRPSRRISTQPGGRVRPGPTGATSTGRATAVLAVGTFASRLTGFVRVLVIGYVLGVGSLSDAFNIANGVPNIVYDLLLGGILSATLIPVFVEHLGSDDPKEGAYSISAVLSAITVALAAMSALLWLLAPWVIRFYLILNSTSTGPAERALATRLLHDFAPQVFLLGAIVVSTALLNAKRRFGAAAMSPVINNLIAIAALLVTKSIASAILRGASASPATALERLAHDQRAILILGFGTTAGYLVQFVVQLPAMARAGLIFRPVWDLRHPAVRRVAALSSWLLGVVLANQASLALVMILAAKSPSGVTAYQFSYQFFQLPYALIAVSVASAVMPHLAQRWTNGDRAGFERQFVTGLRVTLAMIIPVGMTYVAIAQPFIQLAIHHGQVKQSGAHLIASSLALFAVGLPGFSAYFLLMRAYQAMQDARSMFWIYVFENALTVVAALVLDHLMGVPGLALAWVAPYSVASIVAAVHLRRRVGPLGGAGTVRALVRITLASGISTAAVVGLGLPFGAHRSDLVLVARLIVQVGAGGLVYLVLARVMGIRELRPVLRMLRRLTGSL